MALIRHKFIAVLVLLGLALGQTATAGAQSAARFTVTVPSAYLRAAPNANAVRTYSVFQGQSYAITGRTADSTWITLAFAGGVNGTWIRADYGEIEGQLSDVPVVAGPAQVQVPVATPPAPDPVASGGGGATTTVPTAVVANNRLTITAASTYVRDGPDWNSNRVASLFAGKVVPAVARDVSGEWVQVLVGGPGWVPAGVGKLDVGTVMDLPVADFFAPGAPPPPAPGTGPTAPLPDWIPTITPRMRQIYQSAGAYGRSHRLFTVVGDCNSESWLYLELVAKNLFPLTGHEYLWSTVLQFKQSFYRQSVAVNGGFTTASVLDPLWADPAKCRRGESPFACELRLSRASIVFIQLGTGDHSAWEQFEGNYRRMIEYSLSQGVLPVVLTKADALESQEGGAEPDYINNVIRRLAAEYEVPLLDFHRATAELPNHGLMEEPGNDFHLSAAGIGVHVLTTLQTLHAIWHP